MTPLEKAQKESMIRRISFIEVELGDLQAFGELDYETYRIDRVKRRNIERIAENVTNAVIDLGKIVLAGEKVDVPGTYREVFTRLSEAGLLSQKLAEKLGELSRTRNMLAHQYLDFKWEKLKSFIIEAPSAVDELIKTVDHLLKPDE